MHGVSSSVQALAYAPVGELMAWLEWDELDPRLVLQTLDSTETIHFPNRTRAAKSLAFAPDGSLLAIGFGDGAVEVRKTRPHSNSLEIAAHTGAVRSVAFSADSSVLATAGADSRIRLWDACTGKPRGTLSGHHAPVNGIAFAPDGTTLAAADASGVVALWNWRGTPAIRCLRQSTGDGHPVTNVAFSPDGSSLAAGNVNRQVAVYEASTGRHLCTFGDRTRRSPHWPGHTTAASSSRPALAAPSIAGSLRRAGIEQCHTSMMERSGRWRSPLTGMNWPRPEAINASGFMTGSA